MKRLINISYGSTAAIVTSMALIVGLESLSDTRIGLVASLLVVAIADNVSDSFSIHIFQESSKSLKPVQHATVTNFLARLFISLSFLVIVLMLDPPLSQLVSVFWGMSLLAALSYNIAKVKETSVVREILYHLLLAATVILISQVLAYLIPLVIS